MDARDARGATTGPESLVPIAVSARHVHLRQQSIDLLFGKGYRLRPQTALSQPGQYAAEETVRLIGPRGRMDHVRIVGPPRATDQVEISRSDEFALGLDAPVRLSGDLDDTPGIRLEGPAGHVTLGHGVVRALRHIHMSPAEAQRLGLHDHDVVQVAVGGHGRDLVFGDVVVRISPDYHLEVHLDTDEGNAAGVQSGDFGRLLLAPPATAQGSTT